MKDIAASLGLTKSTLYLYFKTKEEVFLALYVDEFRAIFLKLDQYLANQASQGSTTLFIEQVIQCMQQHESFLKLNSILHTVLEKNIDLTTALAFKQLLQKQLLFSGALLEHYFKHFKEGQGTELLLIIHQLQIGCFHACSASSVSKLLQSQPEMQFMVLDFYTEFSKSIRLLLKGMEENK